MAYALLIGLSSWVGSVPTGCLIDVNVPGQRKMNTLALRSEIVFFPRTAFTH